MKKRKPIYNRKNKDPLFDRPRQSRADRLRGFKKREGIVTVVFFIWTLASRAVARFKSGKPKEKR